MRVCTLVYLGVGQMLDRKSSKSLSQIGVVLIDIIKATRNLHLL